MTNKSNSKGWIPAFAGMTSKIKKHGTAHGSGTFSTSASTSLSPSQPSAVAS